MPSNGLQIGYSVEEPKRLLRPRQICYQGEHAQLTPVNAEQDIDELFENSHGTNHYEQLWTYMPYGPFIDKAQMLIYLQDCEPSQDPMFFTVTDKAVNKKIGLVSFLNIVPTHLTLELGHIWYSPLAQGTKVNTQVIYLMLCECFDRMAYRRVEWKCNALNTRSRAAAQRLGFSFEGVFYKHQINKGRNRDTAWFAMLDDDWVRVKPIIRRWLDKSPDGFSLTQEIAPLLRAVDTKEAG